MLSIFWNWKGNIFHFIEIRKYHKFELTAVIFENILFIVWNFYVCKEYFHPIHPALPHSKSPRFSAFFNSRSTSLAFCCFCLSITPLFKLAPSEAWPIILKLHPQKGVTLYPSASMNSNSFSANGGGCWLNSSCVCFFKMS